MTYFEWEFNDNDCCIEKSDAFPDTKVTIIQSYSGSRPGCGERS